MTNPSSFENPLYVFKFDLQYDELHESQLSHSDDQAIDPNTTTAASSHHQPTHHARQTTNRRMSLRGGGYSSSIG